MGRGRDGVIHMDFKFSEEDEAFRQEFRSWLEAKPSARLARRWRAGDPETKTEFERRRAWHRKLDDAGWMCIHWPKEYGGRGATLLQQIIYNQELDRAKAPPVVNFQGIARVGPTLMQWGTPEQKKRYIPRIPSAEEIWCQGLSEPNHGSDLAAVETRAVDDGRSLRRQWLQGLDLECASCGLSTLLCRTDPDAAQA